MNQVTSTQGIATFVSSLFDEGRAIGRTIRCTTDSDGVPEMLSVIDVIAVLCDCDAKRAQEKYVSIVKNLSGEQVSDFFGNLYKFAGPGQRDTPIASPVDLIRIISQLPCNKYPKVDNMRTKFAEVITRAIGGDPTLAMEVMATNNAYESGMIEPDHPLQAFRTQAGELQNKELACDPRVVEMMQTMNAGMGELVSSVKEMRAQLATTQRQNEELHNQLVEVRTQLTTTQHQNGDLGGQLVDMRTMNSTLSSKLVMLVERMRDLSKSRVIEPSNEEKHEVFTIYKTQTPGDSRYQYYISKCYLEYEEKRKAYLVERFKGVTEVRRIVHPNAGALYQLIREHANTLHLKFYYSGMSFIEDANIDEVLDFVDKMEHDRLMVSFV